MKILMAEHAGFCFGVKRAVDAIEKALKSSSEVWTIGLPIHNPQEVSRLEAMGLRVADDEREIPDGSEILIRAHGEPLSVIKNLQARNIKVQDMTCPFVKKAQDMAENLSRENYFIILLGDKKHPEIKGILGHVVNENNAEVVADENEAENVAYHAKIALISQTTQREEKLSNVTGILTQKCSELRVCNTICKATAERQDAVKELVKNYSVDGVVLIGGKTSANTGKLREVINSQNNKLEVLWVEDENEIESNLDWFKNKNLIGIAAGASTPAWLIDKIKSNIAEINFSGGIHQ